MSESPPPLSVVIVNWNTRPLLANCLASLYATVPDIADVWVVDNASRDDSVAFLQAHYPQVNIIANGSNVGFAAANNQALPHCRRAYALLLNSDALLLPSATATLLSVMEAAPRAAAIAPMLVNADGSFQAGPNDEPGLASETLLALGIQRFLRGGHYPGYALNAPPGAYGWVGGTCLVLRRAAWEQVGLFDPSFFMYAEEADWCRRARRAGWSILYEPSARVIHLGGGSSRQAAAAMRAQLYKSKLLFFCKHQARWQTAVLRWVLLTTSALKAALYGALARVRREQAAGWQERAASFHLVYDTIKRTPLTRAPEWNPRLQ